MDALYSCRICGHNYFGGCTGALGIGCPKSVPGPRCEISCQNNIEGGSNLCNVMANFPGSRYEHWVNESIATVVVYINCEGVQHEARVDKRESRRWRPKVPILSDTSPLTRDMVE